VRSWESEHVEGDHDNELMVCPLAKALMLNNIVLVTIFLVAEAEINGGRSRIALI